MRHLVKLILALAGLFSAALVHAQQPSAEQQTMIAQVQALLKDLHPVEGEVAIAEAEAMLHLGKDYYFLPAAEAKRVLVEGWGNPPETVGEVLGMVFPSGKTFLDDTWGAVVTWQPLGYVSDEDAQSADYGAMLAGMQEGEEEMNAERTRRGYPAQHLVGWAQPPVYDARSHSVVWAQNIQYQGQPVNTLNYDVRLLGRRGVLSLNMVTDMGKLAATRAAAAKFAAAAEFRPGARYADYKPGTDAKAEFGIAGLVAAGVGAAAAKKAGLLALILAFGKKFFVLILAGFALLGARFRRVFGLGGRDEEPATEYADHAAQPAVSTEDEALAASAPSAPAAPPPDRSWVG